MLIAEDVGAVRRARRSKADIDDIRAGLYEIVEADQPMSVTCDEPSEDIGDMGLRINAVQFAGSMSEVRMAQCLPPHTDISTTRVRIGLDFDEPRLRFPSLWGVVQVNLELLPIRELSPLLHRRIYRSHLGQERLLLASLRILLQ
jgi:hypothetical protein